MPSGETVSFKVKGLPTPFKGYEWKQVAIELRVVNTTEAIVYLAQRPIFAPGEPPTWPRQ